MKHKASIFYLNVYYKFQDKAPKPMYRQFCFSDIESKHMNELGAQTMEW